MPGIEFYVSCSMISHTFTVIYNFRIKPKFEERFIENWERLTELIYQHEGSFGSHLYEVGELEYISIARWPDRETWKNSGNKLPESANVFRRRMREACESMEKLYELKSVSNLLYEQAFGVSDAQE